jgi:hypothetical protein
MLDIKTMKKDRLRYFNKRAGRVALKFDLWKALDFERDLEVASTQSDDAGIQILKYVHDHGKEATNPIKDVQFKELS